MKPEVQGIIWMIGMIVIMVAFAMFVASISTIQG